jgi:HPt (histidine-containing phosphotransfer) domain-containing protein
VEELLGRCLGDPEFVELILIAFRDRAGAMMQQLEDALAANDANLAARAAHGIKGAAANLSASTLRDLAAELEDVGHRGCLDAARRCHDRLKNSVKACIDYIPRAVTETAAAAKRSE